MTNDTICALATSPGGAIAVIRLSGETTFQTLEKIFSKKLSDAPANTLHYGHIIDGTSAQEGKGEMVDDVIVSVFRAPHSYTGEDAAEISCHGSRYIVQRILQLLIRHGARQAQPGEFTQRAFLNGKMDLSQAEAVADLIASTNAATHRMAISQLRGGFSRELSQLREQLLQLTALLELELDFSDQDVEFADRKRLLLLAETISSHIQKLTDSFQTGNALKNGVPVAIIGAPNVGKSTLLNTLLHDERAIVSDIQGTTRDLVEDVIQIKGITFRFIDTAGIRRTKDQIEKLGIERSLQAAERAQIIILLTEPNVAFPELRIDSKPIIRVINKCDQNMPSSSFLYHKRTPGQYIHISALKGDGIQLLEEALVREAALPELSDTETVVTNVRHYEALMNAQTNLQRVIASLSADNGTPMGAATAFQPAPTIDLIAEDLRLVLSDLAEITGGKITSQETLNEIFSRFCVGK